jgi:hypothetical protein
MAIAFTAAGVRASIERAGDEHWRALVDHHEQAYPRPCPTPGAICFHEAQRLNDLYRDTDRMTLVESRVTRIRDEVEIAHLVQREGTDQAAWTEPYRNYAPEG